MSGTRFVDGEWKFNTEDTEEHRGQRRRGIRKRRGRWLLVLFSLSDLLRSLCSSVSSQLRQHPTPPPTHNPQPAIRNSERRLLLAMHRRSPPCMFNWHPSSELNKVGGGETPHPSRLHPVPAMGRAGSRRGGTLRGGCLPVACRRDHPAHPGGTPQAQPLLRRRGRPRPVPNFPPPCTVTRNARAFSSTGETDADTLIFSEHYCAPARSRRRAR